MSFLDNLPSNLFQIPAVDDKKRRSKFGVLLNKHSGGILWFNEKFGAIEFSNHDGNRIGKVGDWLIFGKNGDVYPVEINFRPKI